MTQKQVPFNMTTQLDASIYSRSVVGAAPAQSVYGIQSGRLSYPVGTSGNLALQNFDPPPESLKLNQLTYAAEISGFSTDLECEVLPLHNATKTFLPWYSIQAPFFVVNITTDSCQIENAIVGEGADHGYYKDNNATQNYQGFFRNYTCNTGGDNSLEYPPVGNGLTDHRFLMSMVSLRWSPHEVDEESPNIWVEQLTGILCKPRYSIDRYSVLYTQEYNAPNMQAVKIPGTNSTLEGFDDEDLTLAVLTTLKNATFGQGGADYVVLTVPSFFQLLEAMNNNSNLQPLIDPTLLLNLGSQAYKELSAQIAYQYLMKIQNNTIFGSLTFLEDRLQVKRLTVGLMTTCLGLLVCIGIFEAFACPWNCIACEPESISSMAVILAASRSIRNRLTQTGSSNSATVEYHLSRDRFQTVTSRSQQKSFSIERVPQSSEAVEPSSLGSSGVKFEWWRPIFIQSWFIALVISIPLLFIILLEVFQHISDSHQGLLDMNSSDSDSRILSTYLPAFSMICVATLYTCLDFNVSIFAPFSALRRGNTTATRSIMVNLAGKLPPHALYLSIRSHYFGACLTILAGFVSSFLTIVVSGLYSLETVSRLQTVSLQQLDNFNFTHIDLSLDDGSAGTIADLIQYSNITYPQWTYDNLVLPSLSAPLDEASILSNQSASISVNVPAIRASLECHAVPSSSIQINSMGGLPNCTHCNDLVQLTYLITLPYSLCGYNVTNQSTDVSWSQTYAVPNDSSLVFAGKGTDLQWTASSELVGDGAQEPAMNGGPADYDDPYTDNSLTGCPSFAFSLGIASAGTKSNKTEDDGLVWNSHSNIGITYCYQRLEQVLTNVTFSYPGFAINSTIPPLPIESSAHDLSNGSTTSPNWFDISVNTLINSLQDLGTSVTGRDWINPFIQALIWGKDGIPIDQLYNNGNSSILISAANRLYAQYIAQAISANMRTTKPLSGQTLPLYNATLGQPSQRLQQNRGPKIALQVMLGFMVLCAIGAYLVADMKRVLPHNPCSIAGTMSLLADSEMCESKNVIPEGSEWKSKRQLRREGVFSGIEFRMGWWTEGRHGQTRRFGIDVQEKDMLGLAERGPVT